ncbi:conserved Plasmodium protein, unknown function [Plasmodium ovale]|uniref:Uncharacterized protein n=2 Tax=Plasmodium ovale TaxID=36330 RepID=A0A1A8W2T4_PLAOA|nr:conserved Plasmodium protein, unknown function [Plasmodium ovale curtisi]SBS94950.1 conserved Plasmodium protein, unknown function [Plasmodium ovale curtisi]SCP05132.1 conserved Plasmodium protein, unknown function [Plasmodium ovale]
MARMKKFVNWCTFVILGTAIPLGLSTLSLCYLNVDKEKKEVHAFNDEYRRRQRENLRKAHQAEQQRE